MILIAMRILSIMRCRYIILVCCFVLLSMNGNSQNTVGLISYDITQSYQGYTLIYPHNQPNIYLLDNCGEIAHSWTDSADFRPGNTAYLRSDGSLVKSKRNASIAGDNIWAGGGGAFIEIRSWENELLWSFEMNNDSMRLHHDFSVMPNGNLLLIAWELKTKEEAIAAGRDTALITQDELWPDMIFEINPANDEIVWEWHAWDHLIQDYDSTKANFGVVSDHRELININYQTNNGGADWLHANSLDYNQDLDQIMISIPTFSEIWIIDHNTTTTQAAGHNGGTSNHGGDLLYRVGNMAAYDKGTEADQILFYQHDAHWANEFVPEGHPFEKHIVCFNNRLPDYSAVEIFQSSWSMYIVDYESFDGTYPPYSFSNTVTHPDTFAIYSTGLSSGQILPNGNMLICSGRQGYTFEVTPNGEIVWEYITPLLAGDPVDQGTQLELNNNLTFRAFRYPMDYDAFDGRDLSSKGFIELQPVEDYCERLVSISTPVEPQYELFPNPSSDMVHLSWDNGKIVTINIYDIMGRLVLTEQGNGGMKYLNVGSLEPNIYVIEVEGLGVRKLVVQ